MRRIVIAFASSVTGLVLLFSYPTSLNRSTAAAATAAAGEGTSVTEESSGESTSGSSGDASTDSSGSASSSGSDSASGDSGTTTQAGVSGTFDGAVVSTRYGDVQVEIVVADGVVTSADAIQHPSRDRESQQINSYAVPALNDEVVSTQSANISMISGATITSSAYLQSLQSAFDAAGL